MQQFRTLRKIRSQDSISEIKFSIATRVKNEFKWIRFFFDSLKAQTFYRYLDIVFLDSGSTDGTLEFLEKENCNLYSIASSEFSFGETCNLMMQLTKGDHVLFFSGHVELESQYLVEEVQKFIDKIGTLSGYFRQVPNEQVGCSIYDKVFLKYNFPTIDSADPEVKVDNHRFSNAASIVSRSHWEEIKFKPVIASEDAFWADEVVKKFRRIYYFHMFNVKHSHNETFDDVKKRVGINVLARYPSGIGFLQRKFIFAKVFSALFINTFDLVNSYKFAVAHSSAYKI
ncbi:Glycosyltransferase, GT2 family [Pedobacter terrae]|uniref:Glycosyltransferase, GT2 family n=1 Tax=Pedobacter terrae TaxID=405671 RepID=A0A1G7RPP2_9SPHI|nr:glycosyltransferase family A protein [Pedobacter terrae]SDG12751.1 Glycosyltransferase, GT2 family [Pedobacter terrae]